MIKGRPLFERLIVQDIPVIEVTEGGVLLPEQIKDAPTQGIVRKIGHTAKLDRNGEMDETLLNEGDVVLYTKYAGTPFEYNGESYKIIMVNEIIFVYDNEYGKQIIENSTLKITE